MSIVHERRSDSVLGHGADAEHAVLRPDGEDNELASGSSAGKWDQQRDSDSDALPSSARPALRRFGHHFFSEELSACRREYLKPVLRATILTLILTWASLPIYWGSLSAAAKLTGNLEAWVINRDPGRIGLSFENAILAAPSTGSGALWWRLVNASLAGDDDTIAQAIIGEQAWVAVVVSENATALLTAARASGDETYDPSSVFTVYYAQATNFDCAQARNEVATGTYMLPIVTSLLSNFTSTYATGSAQRFLATIIAEDGTVNTTALTNIARAPQTMTPGVGYHTVNLRPYTASVAQAVLLVGQIYLCIFTFIITMAHATARDFVRRYLIFSSYVAIRIVTPLILYLPLSLCYSMVSLAFKLPFGTRYTYGEGFLLFFAIIYLGMSAFGLALEAMTTLLTPKFIPFFLILLIIANISTAAIPPELQPKLYAYGAGFPFWNLQQAMRTIFFNTTSHLPTNAGVLMAWILLSCCTLACFTWLVRLREVRGAWVERGRGRSMKAPRDAKGKGTAERGKGGGDEKEKRGSGGYVDVVAVDAAV
ncbi:hypothetical protein EW145_g8054 [Phellinidium pouzarii]|uniref:DUF3533 domain-containing protein n=1 Tax=Phellinidium pouzarii TaxID=167371 RepID=A0A4S4KAI5_9AGAM|nr:hypothetical protein EW145_g8054 [Phellinidium pouzarii]